MLKTKQKRNNRSLRCEQLEERWTPAQFGIPWADSTHLTMSIVPDGTRVETESSQLSTALDAQMARVTWQRMILQAAQTWANAANLNIGLVNDGGQPIGVAGAPQGDVRFGDIRVAGLPLGDDALAVSIPPSHTTTGTYAGDIIINTRAQFTPEKLYAVLMHEMGHVLGLDHSTDTNSVMYPTVHTPAVLTAGDIAAITELYGRRAVDFNEGRAGNNTLKDATRIRFSVESGGYDGSTPIIGYGDIGSATDLDYFEVRTLDGYQGPITFRVQTSGISMLTPRVWLIDSAGRVLQTKLGVNSNGTVVTIQIPQSVSDGKYFLRIDAATHSTYKFGRYGVAVTFDGLLQPTGISIDAVLRGRYESLAPENVDQLFKNPAASIFEDDLHLDDTPLTAIPLRVQPGQPSERDLEATGSISDPTDVDFFEVRAPRATNTISSWVMTVTVRRALANGIVPRIQVLDSNQQPVATQIIKSSNESFAVELLGVPSRATYFIRVQAPLQPATGNYNLHVNFGTIPAELNALTSGRLTAGAGFNVEQSLYIARSQMFNFFLTATLAPVTMTIRDLSGRLIHRQTARPGQPTSGVSKMFLPGQYSVTFSSSAAATFRLRGSRITDPIGVVYNSPVYEPQYQPNPEVPVYVFPFFPFLPTPVPFGFGPP